MVNENTMSAVEKNNKIKIDKYKKDFRGGNTQVSEEVRVFTSAG